MKKPNQNRVKHGPNPNRTGLVVEFGNFDQYRIKVDGRLTFPNRRFLRKYIPAITITDSGRPNHTDKSNPDLPE